MRFKENEYQLVKQLMKGDHAAFDELFEKYHKKVFAFSLRVIKNREDAEEIVQEVFYNLWKDRKKLTELKDIEAWIFGICLNIIRKHFRKISSDKKHQTRFTKHYLESDNSTVQDLEFKELVERTDKIIEELPPRQRTIFLLSRKEQMSNAEISKKLNISERTVDNQLSRAKSFIRKALVEGNLLFLLYFFLFID